MVAKRKWKWIPIVSIAMLLGLSQLFVSCGGDSVGGNYQVNLIRPGGARCQYTIGPVQLKTLQSLDDLRGTVGQVAYHPSNLDSRSDYLDRGVGFKKLTTSFSQVGGVNQPVDYETLFGISLYSETESAVEMFRNLDPLADMTRQVPDLGATLIVYEAHRTDDFSPGGRSKRKEIYDNAEYLPHYVRMPNGIEVRRNYFFSYPTDEIKGVALGLNRGVWTHEFGHMVSEVLAFSRIRNLTPSDLMTQNVVASLDEGMSDYFGYLGTDDPAFMECSYPNTGRDLSVFKPMTAQVMDQLANDSNFDSHIGGAIWASWAYRMAISIGDPNAVGRSIVRLEAALPGCMQAGSATYTLTFAAIARCHVAASDPAISGRLQQFYSSFLGSTGGAP